MNLEDLVNNCKLNQTNAWELFYKRYNTFVLKCVKYKLNKLRITPSGFNASDITHEIFHAIWKYNKLETIKNAYYLKTWLSIFSINFTYNYLRKHFYKEGITVSLDSVQDPTSETTIKDLIPDNKSDIIGDIDFKELYAFILSRIDFLPKKQKIAIKLNLIFKKKHVDISRIMNLPISSVSSLILRSKNKLKKNIIIYFQNENK